MCLNFWTRLKEVCGCCWQEVWSFILNLLCRCCIGNCTSQERGDKTTDEEQRHLLADDQERRNASQRKAYTYDKDSHSDLAESSGLDHSEYAVKEPYSAKPEEEHLLADDQERRNASQRKAYTYDKDSNSDLAESRRLDHSEYAVKEPNSAKPEQEDENSKSDLIESSVSKRWEPEVNESNHAKSELEDENSKSDLIESSVSKRWEPEVNESNHAKSELEDKDSNSDLAESSRLDHSEYAVKEPNSAKPEQEDTYSNDNLAESSESKYVEPQVKEPNSAKSAEEEKTTLPSDNTANHDSLQSIQVLTPLPSGFTDTFFEHFEKKLENIGFKAKVIDLNKFNADATSGDVVLFICHNHSRLNDNVKNAVNKLPVELYERIFLIVIHAWNMSSNQIIPSKWHFQDHLYKRFNNTVDIAFSRKDGIQDCEPNTQDAFKALLCLKKDVEIREL